MFEDTEIYRPKVKPKKKCRPEAVISMAFGCNILPWTPAATPFAQLRPGLKYRPGDTLDAATDLVPEIAEAPDRAYNPIWGDDVPLDLEEAAAYTGMPLGTFRQKVYCREIESRLVGKKRKVQPSAVRAYLEQHKLAAL